MRTPAPNTGTVPARYLAFKYGGMSIRNEQGVPLAWISKRLGGKQLDFADESPLLKETFAAELEAATTAPAGRTHTDLGKVNDWIIATTTFPRVIWTVRQKIG